MPRSSPLTSTCVTVAFFTSLSRTPARCAAVHALVASAVAHHDASAVRTRRRVGLVDEGLAQARILAVADVAGGSAERRMRSVTRMRKRRNFPCTLTLLR